MSPSKRFRSYGFKPGILSPGRLNTIADVRGVRVGHATIVKSIDVRTGVTIVDPGIKNLYLNKLPAAISVGNGFGKLVGFTQVEELGTLEAPIALTNTLAVGPVMRAIVDRVIRNTPNLSAHATVNAVVGETNDGILNVIHKNIVNEKSVSAAFRNLSSRVVMGNVGAGTGTRAFSWKGGIGSASRSTSVRGKHYAVGALVQTNFGGLLTIMGVPVGAYLDTSDFKNVSLPKHDGSCMIVLATDAPLSSRQLKRLAARGFLGLARTGSVMAHGSGDYAIAFSTSQAGVEGVRKLSACLPDEELTNLFLAAVEAVEESVYDALFLAKTMKGRDGNVLERIPLEKIVPLLKKKI